MQGWHAKSHDRPRRHAMRKSEGGKVHRPVVDAPFRGEEEVTPPLAR